MPDHPTPLRVLSIGTLYPPYAIGGYEQVWRDVVEGLRGDGHEVLVLASDWKEEHNGLPEDPQIERTLRMYVDQQLDFRSDSWQEMLARETHNDRVLREAIAHFEPDVAFIGPTGGLPLGALARIHSASIPQVAFLGDAWPAYAPRADGWQVSMRRGRARLTGAAAKHGLPPRFQLEHVQRWVSTSEFTRDGAIAVGVPPDAIEAIPPGADTHRFRPRAEHPWRNRLLYAGRVHPNKGVEYAVRALEQLPGYELTVAGAADPRYERKLAGIAQELGVAARVSTLGDQRERLPALYAEADALLFTSVWKEPWGLVPLESMAVGTPVVASSVGGASEYLEDGVNALVVPPRDEDAISSAVIRLRDDPGLRATLTEGGFATAAEYGYDSALKRTVATVGGVGAGAADGRLEAGAAKGA